MDERTTSRATAMDASAPAPASPPGGDAMNVDDVVNAPSAKEPVDASAAAAPAYTSAKGAPDEGAGAPALDAVGRYALAATVGAGGFEKPLSCVRWSPTGELLVCCGADGRAEVFGEGAPGGAWTSSAVLDAHAEGINDVVWGQDDSFCVSVSDDKTAKLWDVERALCAREFAGHESYVFCAALNPSNTLLATGSFDETVKIWDIRVPDALKTINAHSEPITSVAFNGYDGTVLASGSYDGLLRLWDTASGECLATIFAEQAGLSAKHAPVSHAAYSDSGEYVLASTHDDIIRLWRVDGNPCRLKREFEGRKARRYCCKAAFHFACHRRSQDIDRHAVIAGSEDGSIHVWGMQTSALENRIVDAHDSPVLGVDPHPKRDLIASCALRDKTAKLWEFVVNPECEADEPPPPVPPKQQRGIVYPPGYVKVR